MNHAANKLSGDDWCDLILRLAKKKGIDYLLAIPGVYEVVSEDLNNEAVDLAETEALEMSRDEIIAELEARGFQCYDAEGTAELAEALRLDREITP